MPVRSARLGGPVQVVGTTIQTLFTAEAGETWIIKWLTFFNNGAAPTRTQISIGTLGTTTTVVEQAVPANGQVQLPVWIVVRAGEAVQVRNRDNTVNVTVSAHGAELEGVAD